MSTLIFTCVDPEDSSRVREEIRKRGLAVNHDRTTIEVIIDTPFSFELIGKKTDNVDEMLDKVTSTMAELKGITKTNWFIGSSHPELIRRHDLTKPTQKEVDMLKFTEWCGDNYWKVRGSKTQFDGVWMPHSLKTIQDVLDPRNHKTTERLLVEYKSQQ